MIALVKERKASGAVLKEFADPEIKPGHVLARVRAASICGTDSHIYEWNKWAASVSKPPKIMGHEFAAEVVEVGAGVTHAKMGDMISGETHIYCGHCFQCRIGNFHLCENLKLRGVDENGCFAKYVLVSENTLWKNANNLTPEIASVQEPLGNAVHCVYSGEISGCSVLVLGCGPIGLCAIQLCKSSGASKVIAVDISKYRLDLAERMGADETIDGAKSKVKKIVSSEFPKGVDVVLEMSGAPSALSEGLKLARSGGRVTLLGLPSGNVSVDFSNDVILKGLTIQGIFGRKIFATWELASKLLRNGSIDLAKIITHRLKLEDYEKAFELMSKGLCGKIVLRI